MQLTSIFGTPDEPFAGIEGHFRLTVRERDSEFFQNNIQKMGRMSDFLDNPPANLPDSRQRMLENASHLRKELSKLDKAGRDALTGFIIQHCYLVVVSTSDQGSAYRIFSVLNDRGLDLSSNRHLESTDNRWHRRRKHGKLHKDLGRRRGRPRARRIPGPFRSHTHDSHEEQDA